jgi:hypothetical protein
MVFLANDETTRPDYEIDSFDRLPPNEDDDEEGDDDKMKKQLRVEEEGEGEDRVVGSSRRPTPMAATPSQVSPRTLSQARADRMSEKRTKERPVVRLKRLFSPGEAVKEGEAITNVDLHFGSTYLGRGPLLQVSEVKCSRKQMLLHIEPSGAQSFPSCTVHLTALGVNPSVLHRVGQEAVVMKRGEPQRLQSGDRFSLLVSPPIVFRCDFLDDRVDPGGSSPSPKSHFTPPTPSSSSSSSSKLPLSDRRTPDALMHNRPAPLSSPAKSPAVSTRLSQSRANPSQLSSQPPPSPSPPPSSSSSRIVSSSASSSSMGQTSSAPSQGAKLQPSSLADLERKKEERERQSEMSKWPGGAGGGEGDVNSLSLDFASLSGLSGFDMEDLRTLHADLEELDNQLDEPVISAGG